MAPLLSQEQSEYIDDLYHKKKLLFGRDKLWKYITLNKPKLKISRRQVMDFINKQKVNQIHQYSKGKPKTVISKLVKPVIKDNVPSYEVMWKNYKGGNTIEPRDQLLKDVPKKVRLYEKKNNVIFYQMKKTKKWRFKIESE